MTPPVTAPTFAALLQQLHADKHTGPVLLHFSQGMCAVVDLVPEPMRIVLDTGTRPRASLTR